MCLDGFDELHEVKDGLVVDLRDEVAFSDPRRLCGVTLGETRDLRLYGRKQSRIACSIVSTRLDRNGSVDGLSVSKQAHRERVVGAHENSIERVNPCRNRSAIDRDDPITG